MKIKRIILGTIFTLMACETRAVNDVCRRWFEGNKLKSSDNSCLLKCASTIVDMGTFFCPDQCDELCKPNKLKCKAAKAHWESKLINNRPESWPHKKEKTKSWKNSEKELLYSAFEKIPRPLWQPSLNGIYRMEKSWFKQNPGSSAKDIIVLYDAAFANPKILMRTIIHELAHEYYRELNENGQAAYRMSTGWYLKDEELWSSRNNGFVAEDGRDSPEEDFANNVEFFLIEPSRLKSLTPAAYDWIKQRFGDNFKLGEKCEE